IGMVPTQYLHAVGTGYPSFPSEQVLGTSAYGTAYKDNLVSGFAFIFNEGGDGNGASAGDQYETTRHDDTAEYLRTTLLPRISKINQILELLKLALQEHGEDAEPILSAIQNDYLDIYFNVIKTVYGYFDEVFDPLFTCMLDVIKMENQRRVFVLEMEMAYYKKIHLGLQFLQNRVLRDGQRDLTLTELRAAYPQEAIWSDPFYAGYLAGHADKNWLDFLNEVINTPDPQQQIDNPWLKSVFRRNPGVEVSQGGKVLFHIAPQRFAYRIKRYLETGFWKDSADLSTYEDAFINDFTRYPESFEEVDNSPPYTYLFDRPSKAVEYSENQDSFVDNSLFQLSAGALSNASNREQWFGTPLRRGHDYVFRKIDIDTSRLRNFKERARLLGTTCSQADNQDDCLEVARQEFSEKIYSEWAELFEIIYAPPAFQKIVSALGHRSIYDVGKLRVERNGMVNTWLSSTRQYFMDPEENVLPYFDYPFALLTSDAVSTSAILRNRVFSTTTQGSGDNVLEFDWELARARTYFEQIDDTENQYSLNAEGQVLPDLIARTEIYNLVNDYEELVNSSIDHIRFNYTSDTLTPINVFFTRGDEQPQALNPWVVREVRQELEEFHCDTDYLFSPAEIPEECVD
ncbi:MAG: hypothetical protein AAF202_01150, partial [Pseudomonadota bacterium]